jgi:hypothetical protein
MKTILAVFGGIAVTASPFIPTAQAGDREWATAGKILTGVAAVHVLSRAFDPPPVYQAAYVAPAPVVVQAAPQTVYVQPAPVVVQQVAPAPVVAPAPTVAAAPVAPAAPVVVTQPVYVQPAPVYVAAPQPVYVAPVYYYPRPVISFGFGFGGYHHGHRRW